jgi:crotonobetainyl-CoA:carnitine CoA-transferase CaiB-like acyl-CoA transferase
VSQPFSNVRILDFTHFLAGPFGTVQFALFGADVVKIEPPGGDDTRTTTVDRKCAAEKMAPAFMAVNSNKRSIVLDLAKPAAVDVVKRLVREADVVWENFRPGVMTRLGIGYETLSAINPALIYCALSGFGQEGPERDTAAFDGKIQAMSGIMSITGDPAGGPMRTGFAACDLIGGMTSAFAVASALYQRTHTGKGQYIDVSLLDATLNFLGTQLCEYTLTGLRQGQFGNLSVSRKVTAHRFRAGDGYLVLAVLTDRHFGNLMRALGREDALADPRFRDWFSRAEHEPALRAAIEGGMREGTAKSWEQRLTAADVPCATVHSISEIVDHPQLAYRDVLQRVETGEGSVRIAGPAFKLSHGTGGVRRVAPRLGQNTEELLREAGYDEAAIARMRAEGAVGGHGNPAKPLGSES